MKWLIPLLAVQLTTLGALPPMSVSDPAFLGHNRGAAAPAPTYLINQNFEGTGYDNGETWTDSNGSATFDEDYTGVVLTGAQSMRVVPTAGADAYIKSATFASTSDIWAYFQMHIVATDGGNILIFRIKNGGTVVATMRLALTGPRKLECFTATGTATTVDTLATGTKYHIWFHYKADPSGIIELGFSTDGTEPTSGNKYASMTSNTESASINNIEIGLFATSTSRDYVFDRVLVDNADIGDNP